MQKQTMMESLQNKTHAEKTLPNGRLHSLSLPFRKRCFLKLLQQVGALHLSRKVAFLQHDIEFNRSLFLDQLHVSANCSDSLVFVPQCNNNRLVLDS